MKLETTSTDVTDSVVIPLNRVKVSTYKLFTNKGDLLCRNPLKSGQGFNDVKYGEGIEPLPLGRNPLKSGQGFNRCLCNIL